MSSPDAGARRGARFHIAALTVSILLALAETWPLATALTTHLPLPQNPVTGAARDHASSDQLLTSWILASSVRRLGQDPLGVFDTNNMAPVRLTLAYSENLLGMTALVWPAQVLWDNPVLTDNLALLATITLNAYGVLLLVHELTGSAVAAVAGAALDHLRPLRVGEHRSAPPHHWAVDGARLVRARPPGPHTALALGPAPRRDDVVASLGESPLGTFSGARAGERRAGPPAAERRGAARVPPAARRRHRRRAAHRAARGSICGGRPRDGIAGRVRDHLS